MHVCGILLIKRSWKGRRSEDPLVGRFQLRELRRDQITHRRHRPVRAPHTKVGWASTHDRRCRPQVETFDG